MVDISKHHLLRQCYELCHAIEECGASPALTAAVTNCSALLNAINEELYPELPENATPVDDGVQIKVEIWNMKERLSDDVGQPSMAAMSFAGHNSKIAVSKAADAPATSWKKGDNIVGWANRVMGAAK